MPAKSSRSKPVARAEKNPTRAKSAPVKPDKEKLRRQKELTQLAVDWLGSCYEDLFENFNGRAALAADQAILITLQCMGQPGETKSWIHRPDVVAAAKAWFEDYRAELAAE